MRRLRFGLLLGSFFLLYAGSGHAASIAHGASRDCGTVTVKGSPRTEVVVEIGTLACASARRVVRFALGHVVPGGAAATFRGPKGWACTFGVFPLKPNQHGSRYDTAHSMSCATPANTEHIRVMIAGFFAS
jgi:hypothetical protein